MPDTELEEQNVDFFEFNHLKKGVSIVKVAPEKFDDASLPYHVSLLVISKKYGYLVAATPRGFVFSTTKQIRDAFLSAEPHSATLVEGILQIEVIEGAVEILRISADELTLIVGIKGNLIYLYDITSFANKSSTIGPYREIAFKHNIKDIRPNTGYSPNILAVLLDYQGVVVLRNFQENKNIGTIQPQNAGDQVSAICWSPKGKQLVCGTASGKLTQYTIEGVLQLTIPLPTDLSEKQDAYKVLNVLWMESSIYLVAYFPMVPNEDSFPEVYIVSREQRLQTTYIKAGDLTYKSQRDRSPYYYMEAIRDWGEKAKNMVIISNTFSTETAIVCRSASGNWASWRVDDDKAAILPLSRIPDSPSDDTIPFGMAIDFSDTDKWLAKVLEDSTEMVPPVPILYILNDEGDLVAYRCFNKAAYNSKEECLDMTAPQNIPSNGPSGGVIISTKMLPSQATLSQEKEIINQPSMRHNTPSTPPPPPPVAKKNSIPHIIFSTPPIIPSQFTNFPSKPPLGLPTSSNIFTTPPISHSSSPNIPSPASFVPSINSQSRFASPIISVGTPTSTISESNDVTPEFHSLHEERIWETNNEMESLKKMIRRLRTDHLMNYRSKLKPNLMDPLSCTVGDFPGITSMTKILQKETQLLKEQLHETYNEISQLNESSLKVHQMNTDIGLILEPSPLASTNVRARIRPLQQQAMDKVRGHLQTVKEAAKVVEERIITLHALIEQKKHRNIIERSPMEMINSSIRNISTALYYWDEKLEKMSVQMENLYLENQKYRRELSQAEEKNRDLSNHHSQRPIRCLQETEKEIEKYLNRQDMIKRLGKKLRSRKTPLLTKPMKADQLKPIHKSPITIAPRNIPSFQVRISTPPSATKEVNTLLSMNSPGFIESPLRNLMNRRAQEHVKARDRPYERRNEGRVSETHDYNNRLYPLINTPEPPYGTALQSLQRPQTSHSEASTSFESENSDSVLTAFKTSQVEDEEILSTSAVDYAFNRVLQAKPKIESKFGAGFFDPSYKENIQSTPDTSSDSISDELRNFMKDSPEKSTNDSIQGKLDVIANTEVTRLFQQTEVPNLLMSAALKTPSDNREESSFRDETLTPEASSSDDLGFTTAIETPRQELTTDKSQVGVENFDSNISHDSLNEKTANILETNKSKMFKFSEMNKTEDNSESSVAEEFEKPSTTPGASDDSQDKKIVEQAEENKQSEDGQISEIKHETTIQTLPIQSTPETLESQGQENDMDMGGISQSLDSINYGTSVESVRSPNLSAFDNLVTPTQAPIVPSSGFGAPSTSSLFGAPSTPSLFGAPSTPSLFGGPSVHAGSLGPVTAFGPISPQPTPPSAFGQAGGTPLFGQSGFSQPAFGQPSFGQPSFQQTSTFGQPSFGQPSFGQIGFGQSSATPSTFGVNASFAAAKPPSGAGFAKFAANTSGGAMGFGKPPDPTSSSNIRPLNNPSFTQFRG
ncbi:hypothetical protein G9A89_010887 [Geosiphon pyriformis]|nr:hypothetical protein G9A89_010887 [Geosiphon pyriformis]